MDYSLNLVGRIYFLDIPGSRSPAEAVRHIVSAIKPVFRLYRSFSDEELVRLSAASAIENVAASSGVIIPYVSSQYRYAEIHNYRAMFVAGLAHGLERPTLILKSDDIKVPLDIRDFTTDYRSVDDIDRQVEQFREQVDAAFEDLTSQKQRTGGLLQNISVGDPAAENEFTTLQGYYLPVDAFGTVLHGHVDLVTGRKGSGKTALFFRLRDSLRENKQNVIVDLRPGGYQLTRLKEAVMEHLTAGSREYLISAFWHYLLLLEIVHRIIEMDETRHRFDHRISELYQRLEGLYVRSDLNFQGDFSERLLRLTQSVIQRYSEDKNITVSGSIKGSDITRIVYAHDIPILERTLSEYLQYKEGVWILFDNLDRGWSTGGVSSDDVLILRTLVNASRKLKRDLMQKNVNCHTIVFVRNDVYEILMQDSPDYGKEIRVNLDWTDKRQLLELLRRRLEYSYPAFNRRSLTEIWDQLFDPPVDGNTLGPEFLIQKCLMRPRNVIKLFQHCRAFAVNVGHDRIEQTDVAKALEAYARGLAKEVDREIGDVFHRARKIIYGFVHEPSEMTYDDILVLSLSRQDRFMKCSGPAARLRVA